MSKKLGNKKGFTLVEVLVAMFCSILILGSVTGSLIFVNKINNELVSKTSNLYKLRVLEKYIVDNYSKDMSENIKINNGDVIYNDIVIVKNTLIINNGISFTTINSSTTYTQTNCSITYDGNNGKNTFSFIVKIIENEVKSESEKVG